MEGYPVVFLIQNKPTRNQIISEKLMWDSISLMSLELEATGSEKVHRFNHALFGPIIANKMIELLITKELLTFLRIKD